MNYPLSLHHLTMLAAHPLQLVDAAASTGFEYCGLRIVAPTENDAIVDVVNDAALVRELEARFQSSGVRLLDIEAIWLRPSTVVADLIPALEVGQRLGAKHVLAVGHDPDPQRLADNFAQLCEAAARCQMTVALEFITYCAIGSLPAALQLLDSHGRDDSLLLIDALQYFRSGATVSDVTGIASQRLRYLQICDGPARTPESIDERRREARTNRRLPGEGELPVAELLQALPADLILSVEAPTEKLRDLPFNEQAQIVADTTRRFLARLPERKTQTS